MCFNIRGGRDILMEKLLIYIKLIILIPEHTKTTYLKLKISN